MFWWEGLPLNQTFKNNTHFHILAFYSVLVESYLVSEREDICGSGLISVQFQEEKNINEGFFPTIYKTVTWRINNFMLELLLVLCFNATQSASSVMVRWTICVDSFYELHCIHLWNDSYFITGFFFHTDTGVWIVLICPTIQKMN